MSNIAEIGGANVERKIGKASVRDAIIGTGVAVDKLLALTGQTPSVQIANVVLPTSRNALNAERCMTSWTKSPPGLKRGRPPGKGVTRRARPRSEGAKPRR